jgi:hypothetical protein
VTKTRLQPVPAPRRQRHGRALGGEGGCTGCADSARGTGHQRDGAIQYRASPETHSLAATAFAPATPKVPASVAGPACTTHNGRQPNDAHAAVRRAPDQAGSGHRRPDAGSHLEGHLGLAATSRPRPVTPPRLSSRHRATSINSITSSDGEIRENARRPANLRGCRVTSVRARGRA